MKLVGLTTTSSSTSTTAYATMIDPGTGAETTNGSGLTLARVSLGNEAAGDNDIFVLATPLSGYSGQDLYVLNAATGQLTEMAPENSGGLTFDSSNNTLYGIKFGPQNTPTYIETIDPNNGTATLVGSGVSGIYSYTLGAFTANDGVAYLIGIDTNFNQHLYEFSEATGGLLGSPTIAGTSNLTSDPINGQLLGLTYDSTAKVEYLVSIDPVTGNLTHIGAGIAGVQTINQASLTAYDGTAYFEGSNGGSSPTMLYTVSEATGAVLSAAPLASVSEFLGVIPCFCPGTLILTEEGEMAVEDLAIGTRVIASDGMPTPVLWLGRRGVSARTLRSRPDLAPVLIEAGALGDGLPRRDLRVSPSHAMFLDGALVPAECLVNGTTITRERTPAAVRYIHIELMDHELIFAEGAITESFIDDQNRSAFENVAEYDRLYPDRVSHAAPAAPRIEQGHKLEAIRQRLARIATSSMCPA